MSLLQGFVRGRVLPDQGTSQSPALQQLRAPPGPGRIGWGSSNSPECQASRSPSPCYGTIPPDFSNFNLPSDFSLGSISPSSPQQHPDCSPQAPSQPNCHQHTKLNPHSHKFAQLQPSPQQQQLNASSPNPCPSCDSRLTPPPGPPQTPQRLYQPPGQSYLQGELHSKPRHSPNPHTSHSFSTQPTQQVEHAQQIAENFQCNSLDNQAAILNELATRAERSPALTPGPQNSCMPPARRGPRIKTTIRTGTPGHAHTLAVKVVASGRVLTCAGSPTANSANPMAKFSGTQGKSPSPDATISDITVTLAASGSPTPSALDSTVGASKQQRPATAELGCSENLGTASPPNQSPTFQPSPGAYTDSSAPHNQSLSARSVHSPQAATQISASEALHLVAANEHHFVAVDTSPSVLMAAFEAEHAAIRAAAAAAGKSGGAEVAEEWVPDEEAMQAASALAELAESNWAGCHV